MRDLTQPLHPAIDRVRADQLARWQAGERVLVEELLADGPGSAIDDETLLDLLYGEVLLREEFGERPGFADYQRRFPRLTEALRRQFELHQALGSLEERSVETWPLTAEAGRDSAANPSTQRDRGRRRDGPVAIPLQIGQYEVLEELGRGGMGVVYKARHALLPDRIVALKVIRPGSEGDAEALERCATEAMAVAQLDHPNIVRLYELMVAEVNNEETPIVVLEYVSGPTLARAINGTPMPPREAARLSQPLADAVAQAHSRGILHRDLKPANVLLAACEGVEIESAKPQAAKSIPKIADFGLAKRLNVDSGQTRSGAILGTPSYMAPEQARGQTHHVGPAADVYALGAILYEMLTGRPPFKADSVLNTLQLVTTTEPVAPRALVPGVPRDLETICLKCLQKEPAQRYASARALAEDLQRYLDGKPILARPAGVPERVVKWIKRRPAAAALLGVSVLALLGLVAVWAFFTVRLQEEKANALKQRDEARRQKEFAQHESAEARKQSERAGRILALAAAAVDDIAMKVRSAKTEELESGNTGSILFKLACSYARTSATLTADADLILEDRTRLAEQYATSAVRLLRCAEQVDFFRSDRPKNRKELETNADLNCLRERKDFKNFAAQFH